MFSRTSLEGFLAQAVPVTNDPGGGGLLLGIPCVGLVIGLLCLALWIWALVDAIGNKGLESTTRIIWVLVIILLPFIGSILYLVIGRKR